MSKFLDELRKKYPTAKDAIRALGLDESLLKETGMTKPTKFANLALQLTAAVVKPILAKDAQIDLMPVFKDITSKNFDAKKVRLALDSALKGKLAKDADMGGVEKALSSIAEMKPEVADESVSEPQHKAMEAAAHGESNLGIPPAVGKEFSQADKGKTFDEGGMENMKGFLKEKGVADADIQAACDMMFKKTVGDESPEDKMRREEEAKKKAVADASMTEEEKAKKKEAEDKAAADAKAAKDAEMKDMVSKGAMDAALKANSETVAKQIRETERGIRVALDEVKPWVGALPTTLAFDSNIDVYRHAAKIMGIPKHATMHADALLDVIQAQRKPGAKPAETNATDLAQDSAAVSDFNKMYPDAARVAVGDVV